MKPLNQIHICVLLYLNFFSSNLIASDRMKIGIATVDITPKSSIMLVGYASRTEPSTGVVHQIYAKAIAFEDAIGAKAVLVTTDLIGLHRELTGELSKRVQDEYGIPRERLMFTSSHTHTAPLLHRSNLRMYDLSKKEREKIVDYTDFLNKALFKVIQKSLLALSSGSLTFGKGEAHFAMNRRVFSPGKVKIGENPDGPVDTEVPVLAVWDKNGNQKAVLFGYACHGTTLKKDDYYQICGDYMGFAQEYLQLAQPGITSLFVAGCGADINPHPRGTLNDARLHGLNLAGAVANVLSKDMEPVYGPLRCAFRHVNLAFAKLPSMDEFRDRLNSDNPHVRRHARHFLDILEKGKKISNTYPYPIQVWQFGNDLTLIALGGEVVVDYAFRLRRELKTENLWTIAYANDVCGYIGSARILYEGGYEADTSTIYYTLPARWDYDVEERIVSAVKEMVVSRQD